jgi:glutathione S-transferase
VAGHRINLGKRQRSDVKLLYAEIRQNPLFTDNAAFPVGQARFVIWWLSTFPGTIFPTREAVEAALARQHPENFDFQNWDQKLLDNAAERLRQAKPSSEPQAGPSSAQPSRSLADRISVPLRNRITVPLANRITIPLANRITFPANRVNSGRIQKRRSGSRR